jgi:branched-chain amino acid aminotransferase
MQRQVYLNGTFVPESEAKISIFDSALMFGDMVFEVTRTFRHVPFLLHEHLERLYLGLKILEIDCGMTIDEMEEITLETVKRNSACIPPEIDFQITHNVSRGPLSLYRSVFPEGIKPTVSINCWPLTFHLAGLASFYHSGVHCFVARQRNVPSQYIDPKIKNRSRIHYQAANLEAARVGQDAFAVLLDERGYLTEGTGSNIVIVKSGCLITPKAHNILRGVSRHYVIDLAEKLDITCLECDIEPYDMAGADEAFLTSTPFCMLPVTRFEHKPIGDGQVGQITKKILETWSAEVGVDIVQQAEYCASQLSLKG